MEVLKKAVMLGMIVWGGLSVGAHAKSTTLTPVAPIPAAVSTEVKTQNTESLPEAESVMVKESHPSEQEVASTSPLVSPYDKHFSATAGIQVPAGLVFEGAYRPSRRFSFGVDIGTLPDLGLLNSFNPIGDQYKLALTVFTLEGRGRWHPMGGAFFFGVAVGYQRFEVTASKISTNLKVTGTVDGMHVTPHIGWNWIMHNGITLGTELGVLVPLSKRKARLESIDITEQEYVRDELQPFLSTLLPYVNVLKLGYSF